MNVNLWGPSFWTILHSLAGRADETKTTFFDDLVRPLSDLLPCIHCRRSFAIYYQILGKPVPGKCAAWMYDMHNLVNNKLDEQAIDKTILAVSPGNVEFKVLLMASLRSLYPVPSLEVVRKRYLFHRADLFPHKDLSTVVLAFALQASQPNAPYTFDACLTWLKHANTLMNCDQLATQFKLFRGGDDFLSVAIRYKYGDDTPTTRTYASYLKAGTCLDLTCQ